MTHKKRLNFVKAFIKVVVTFHLFFGMGILTCVGCVAIICLNMPVLAALLAFPILMLGLVVLRESA
jgi:hypothetical protein